jgi:oligopeptide transport system permease protein
MHAAPGGPFAKERQVPPEIERRLLAAYGLDLTIGQQLQRYVSGLARGDLGPSMVYKDKDVLGMLEEGAPTSALLGFGAMTLALLMGAALGALAAVRRNRAQDYLVIGVAMAGMCLPPLVMGPLAQMLFGVQWSLLPASGLYRDEFRIDYLILPMLTLSLPIVAIVSRLMRASMIEALGSNAIRTARAKGLPEMQVIWRHALPIALLPFMSFVGPALAGVMAGLLAIETVFQLPGIGRQFVLAAAQRDYPFVMGVVVTYSALVIIFNLAADFANRALDPTARAP